MHIKQLKELIESNIPCKHIEVTGDGHHFFAKIVSSSFNGLGRLERHRLVKEILKPVIRSNELHALSITLAATPEEWQQETQ
ncbi:MAG: BolA/IbaG family iron-sulfur metabolism protein [Neisseriaceae bacterium]